jgi:hypothetical protein
MNVILEVKSTQITVKRGLTDVVKSTSQTGRNQITDRYWREVIYDDLKENTELEDRLNTF